MQTSYLNITSCNIDISKFNKLTHNCASWSVLGVLGEKDQTIIPDDSDLPGYNTRTSDDQDAKGTRVKHFTWNQVEKTTGLVVDTVIFDCEGCWCDVVSKNKEKFKTVNMIIIGKIHYELLILRVNIFFF